MDKLLQEAIADAKAVRETALANAKLALEEAFTPHLKSMLSRKLQAEMDDDSEDKPDDPVDEIMDSSEIGASDNKDPDAAASEADSQGPEEEGSASAAGEEDDEAEKAPDQPVGENVEAGAEDDEAEKAPDQPVGEQEEPAGDPEAGIEDKDDDEELKEVLRQLEQELGMEPGMDDEDEDPMAPEEPVEQEEPIAPGMEDEDDDEAPVMAPGMEDEEGDEEIPAPEDQDEDIDLDEIIKALTEEGEDDEEEAPEAPEAEDSIAKELGEYKQTVQYLRTKLQEVNLLNAKLLYTNKLFRSRNVSEEQKMKVIEQFDRAANVREVKLVYTTFAESMKRKPVNESAKRKSQASKPTTSTESKKPIIGEQVEFKTRMKKLANII
jgi:hypothetical protein